MKIFIKPAFRQGLLAVLASIDCLQAQTPRRIVTIDLPGPKGERFDYLTMDDEDYYLLSAHLGPGILYVIAIQMDATDLFSYKITVTNDGLLPVFWADWALAPRIVQVGVGSSGITPDKHVQLLLPHYARWTIKTSLPSYGMKVFPGSGMTMPEAEDYEFQLKRPDTTVGILAPGDGFTFTTEGLIGAPSGATYDTVGFRCRGFLRPRVSANPDANLLPLHHLQRSARDASLVQG